MSGPLIFNVGYIALHNEYGGQRIACNSHQAKATSNKQNKQRSQVDTTVLDPPVIKDDSMSLSRDMSDDQGGKSDEGFEEHVGLIGDSTEETSESQSRPIAKPTYWPTFHTSRVIFYFQLGTSGPSSSIPGRIWDAKMIMLLFAWRRRIVPRRFMTRGCTVCNS